MLAALATSTVLPSGPQNAEWFLDTGASSHMASNAGNFSNPQPLYGSPPITVGNGATIPVTHTARSTIPTTQSPLLLNNVLVSPSLVKNLISVRSLTRDNNVSVEFDPLGFSVKDLHTRMEILRCNATASYTLWRHLRQRRSSPARPRLISSTNALDIPGATPSITPCPSSIFFQQSHCLAAILLSSELNKRKGAPYIESDENIGCPSDCVIIDNPNMANQASTKKRKHSERAECLVVQKGTSQHIQTQNKSSQVNANQDPDEFWAFEVMKDVQMNKEEMTELLCDYVMAIQNEVTLK
jgi:hypothetical protein